MVSGRCSRQGEGERDGCPGKLNYLLYTKRGWMGGWRFLCTMGRKHGKERERFGDLGGLVFGGFGSVRGQGEAGTWLRWRYTRVHHTLLEMLGTAGMADGPGVQGGMEMKCLCLLLFSDDPACGMNWCEMSRFLRIRKRRRRLSSLMSRLPTPLSADAVLASWERGGGLFC